MKMHWELWGEIAFVPRPRASVTACPAPGAEERGALQRELIKRQPSNPDAEPASAGIRADAANQRRLRRATRTAVPSPNRTKAAGSGTA